MRDHAHLPCHCERGEAERGNPRLPIAHVFLFVDRHVYLRQTRDDTKDNATA